MTNPQPKLRLAWFALAANLSLASLASAQAGEGGQPPSLAGHLATQVPTEVMPPIDVDQLLAEDAIAERDKVPGPYRFGWGHEVALGLEEAGLWEELPGGQRLWRLRVESPGAWSINLIFDRYTLPEGARLWVHNDDGRVLGAFTSALNQPHGMFATEPIPGDAVTLEYVEPMSAPIGSLRIKQVVHAYRDILDQGVKRGGSAKSGSCNINVNCPLGANWQDQKRASARLVMGGGLCSGALINNTAQDGKQFFLTANHCYNGAPGSWVFQFNYESATCAGASGIPQSVTGSVLRSKSTMADHCLVEITQPIPPSYNVYFSGWSRSTTPSTTSTGIHHPQGDIKKICQDTNAVVASSFSGAPCWRVLSWEQGVTEGGSSGSPLYDQNKRLIGQLFGGQATCSFLFNDYYGRFDQSWNGGGTTGTALRFHLDPGGSSPTTLDGMFAGQQSGPSVYCTGKVNSLGGTPQIGWAGTPSVTLNDFVVDCAGGIPNKNTILYWGTGKATTPFMGGLLCAGAPFHREPPKLFDGLGYVQYAVPVIAPMVGTTRNYQFWGRDPNHPDGTGTLLSNALEVPFKN